MSQLTKACIALTDGLLYEDIGDKSGFKDAALNDADRPYLDNHLFLMYDATSIQIRFVRSLIILSGCLIKH